MEKSSTNDTESITLNVFPNNSDNSSTPTNSFFPSIKPVLANSPPHDNNNLPPRKFQFVSHSKFITLAHSNEIYGQSLGKTDEIHISDAYENESLLDDSTSHGSHSRNHLTKHNINGIIIKNENKITFKDKTKLFILASLFFLIEYGIINHI